MSFGSRADLEEAGFKGFIPIAELMRASRADMPETAGNYIVVRPPRFNHRFLEANPAGARAGRRSTIPVPELEAVWVDATLVLYIGKAGFRSERSSLRARVWSYLRQGEGHNAGHSGGCAIWQIAESARLLIAWRESAPAVASSEEQALLQEHAAEYGKRPFANRRF
jgi:hypothetical protein